MKALIQIFKSPRKKKLAIAFASAAILLIAAAGTTAAWLAAQSATLSNSFEAAEVTCDIDETFSGGVKSDVSIRNTGTMDAYIRVALIPVWKDGDSIAGEAASLGDCTIDWGDDGTAAWALGADGYYYCKLPVAAGGNTPVLIDKCTAAAHGGLRFELQICAQAVQALPVSAVMSVWGSAVTGVATDGKLEVAE